MHHVTPHVTAEQDTDERLVAACPTWCDHDEEVDKGTPDEFLIHCGAERYMGSMRLQVRQVMLVDGELEPPVLLLGEEELPMAEATRLATALAATAAETAGARYAHAIPLTRSTVDDIRLQNRRCRAS